ncbi:hypothetical protein CCP3SC1AL1_4330001 [Gammaproteobacteria bacterium]
MTFLFTLTLDAWKLIGEAEKNFFRAFSDKMATAVEVGMKSLWV